MKDDTYFERMEKLKKGFLDFHQNLKLGIDNLFKKEEGSDEINFEF